MVKKYSGGQFVPAGIYWNREAWELAQIPEEGDYLPAGEGATYYRVPLLLVVALGPLIGLAFILFLPLAVPALALYAAAKVIFRNVPWRRQKEANELAPLGGERLDSKR
jgi:hypothetical protein